jgi:hypothetical protein
LKAHLPGCNSESQIYQSEIPWRGWWQQIKFLALAKSDAPDLSEFIRKHEELRLRVAVSDAGVTGDLNTLAHYVHWAPHSTEHEKW